MGRRLAEPEPKGTLPNRGSSVKAEEGDPHGARGADVKTEPKKRCPPEVQSLRWTKILD